MALFPGRACHSENISLSSHKAALSLHNEGMLTRTGRNSKEAVRGAYGNLYLPVQRGSWIIRGRRQNGLYNEAAMFPVWRGLSRGPLQDEAQLTQLVPYVRRQVRDIERSGHQRP